MTTDKSARFEDRLLSELKREVALNAAEQDAAGAREPAPRRCLLTAPRLTLAAAGGAAVAAGFVVVPGMMAPPAYAVEEKPDGSVHVKLEEFTLRKADQQALAADLRAAGISVRIYDVPEGYRCVLPASGGVTVLPGMKGEDGDGLKTLERSVGVPGDSGSGVSDGADAPGAGLLNGELAPIEVTLEEGASMVIENYVLREGEPHLTTYRTGPGDLKPCETEPISEEPAAAEQPE